MRRIMGKRVLRELRAHFLRYAALFVMIAIAIYLIVSLIGAADTVIFGTAEHANKNGREDGQFTVFVPLTQKELQTLKVRNVSVERMFYREYALADGSVLRVFCLRQNINLVEPDAGVYPASVSEIVLEKRYCEEKGLRVGDTVKIAGRELLISGIGTSPDYDAAFRSMGDSTVDSANFGTAFVTEDLYKLLAQTNRSLQAEEYLYAYRLNGSMTDGELKALLKTFSFDPASVEDPYFQAYWRQNYGQRDELTDSAEDLSKGSRDLAKALAALEEGMNADDLRELRAVLPEAFYRSLSELKGAGFDIADGNEELNKAIRELIDANWPEQNENLRSFVCAKDNPRIGAAENDVLINKYASILAGVIVLALLAYVISVFVVHNIEEEQSVIGTLYAIGIRRRVLLRHYLVLPTLISLFAGILGTFAGYSRFGVPLQTADTYAYFSIPQLDTVAEPWVILYGVVMSPLIAAIVNWFVIRQKLSAPALQMIRNEQKQREVSQLDLGRMSYVRRFQLRQLLREGRSAIGVVLGIFVCLLLMMIGINAYVLCVHVGQDNVADTKYTYMYLYKYPEERVPDGGYSAYAENFKKEVMGYNMDVTVLGLESDNPFFDVKAPKSQSRVFISSAMAQKYGLRMGDSFFVNDPQSDRPYAFMVDGVVSYAPAFYIFMEIDSMRELFGADEAYYNVVFSDRDLGIDPGRLYSISTREDVVKAADVFTNLMYGMVLTMILASTAIMGIVMYLMLKVMIDRSAYGIALFKVFGYRKRELGKLFLNGSTMLIVIGALFAIPLAKLIMDAIYPYLVSNVACAINLQFAPWIYAVLFAAILLFYAAIHALLIRRIDQVDVSVVLKNRE